jgi:hypothetical protein
MDQEEKIGYKPNFVCVGNQCNGPEVT